MAVGHVERIYVCPYCELVKVRKAAQFLVESAELLLSSNKENTSIQTLADMEQTLHHDIKNMIQILSDCKIKQKACFHEQDPIEE